jgi:hypothetical protein
MTVISLVGVIERSMTFMASLRGTIAAYERHCRRPAVDEQDRRGISRMTIDRSSGVRQVAVASGSGEKENQRLNARQIQPPTL